MMSLPKDIKDGLINPPPPKVIVDDSGRIIQLAQVSDVLSPLYRRCKSCAAKQRCPRVQKKGNEYLDVDCVIEKDQVDILLARLTLDGITIQDELLVTRLIHNQITMTRVGELISIIDLNKVLRDDDYMKRYKELNMIMSKAEAQYLKLLKELMATRKEDHTRVVKDMKKAPHFDLSKRLSDKKNADKSK